MPIEYQVDAPILVCHVAPEDRDKLCPPGVSEEFKDRFNGIAVAQLDMVREHPYPCTNYIFYKQLSPNTPPIAFHNIYIAHKSAGVECEMWGVYVDEEHRRHDIGFEIMHRAVHFAYQQGVRKFVFRFSRSHISGKLATNLKQMGIEEFNDCNFDFLSW